MAVSKWDYLSGIIIDGSDLVMRGVRATYFGDVDDDMDNGIGASGFHVRAHPEYAGVALPLRVSGLGGLFSGCPMPKLPWFIPVRVWSPKTQQSVYAHLVDLGPNPRTKTPIDLTVGTVRALGLDPSDGEWTVDFRVIGGAKYKK